MYMEATNRRQGNLKINIKGGVEVYKSTLKSLINHEQIEYLFVSTFDDVG